MSLISTKLGPINSSCIKLVRSFISIRSITDSSTKKQVSNETQQKSASTQQEEIDWFSNKSTHSANRNDSNKSESFMTKKSPLELYYSMNKDRKLQQQPQDVNLLSELDIDKKRNAVRQLVDSMTNQDFSLPNDFNEAEWNMLLECNSMNELRISLKKIPKDRYYKLLKDKRKLEVAKRREENLVNREPDEHGHFTNYPGNNSFLRRLDSKYHREYLRHKLIASIRTNAPSIVFDFRYDTFHTKRYLLPSLYRQYVEIVHANRLAAEPFQIHFCNYNKDGPFHKAYSTQISYDENLIFETEKSYLDLFPKDKLVYLSKDASKPLKTFDPNRVYIVGSIIDSGLREDRLASYSQAKRDGIECVRLPLDENVKWYNGSKDLAMNHVFEILLRIYNGKGWPDALKALPTRFTTYRNNKFNK